MTIELTKIQKESIEHDSGDLLIKGMPGAGKSVVLMQRAIRLNKKANEEGRPRKILVLTFTNTLVKYTRELVSMTGLDPCMIEISTIDKCCGEFYRSVANRRFIKIAEKRDRKAYIDQAIQNDLNKRKSRHRFHDIEVEFWVDEFLWIKQKNISSSSKYVDTERTGRGGKVRMTRSDKEVAYAFFEEYSSIMKSKGRLDWEDLYIFLLKNANKIPENMKYDYVMLDEAQDLSEVKIKFAKLIAKESITIAADKAQKIYNTSFSWKELGIDIHGRSSKTLDKSFRSTKQIVLLAESLLEVNRMMQEDQSEYTKPVIPERKGNVPSVIQCKDAAAEQDATIEIIKKFLIDDKNVIGILYRSYSEFILINRWIRAAGLTCQEIKKNTAWSLSTPGIKLCTLHSAKGLEFDTVIIPRFEGNVFPLASVVKGADEEQLIDIRAQERSLLYVGMTRARFELFLIYSGPHPIFLDNFEPEYYNYISSDGSSLPKHTRIITDKPPVDQVKAKQVQDAKEQKSIDSKQSVMSAARKLFKRP
ncbi:MAG: 3'-5' exonuclease [Eubacteriales bacterium]|nr:3'-5' exonuclease [Eubacteriales bacterium]